MRKELECIHQGVGTEKKGIQGPIPKSQSQERQLQLPTQEPPLKEHQIPEKIFINIE